MKVNVIETSFSCDSARNSEEERRQPRQAASRPVTSGAFCRFSRSEEREDVSMTYFRIGPPTIQALQVLDAAHLKRNIWQ